MTLSTWLKHKRWCTILQDCIFYPLPQVSCVGNRKRWETDDKRWRWCRNWCHRPSLLVGYPPSKAVDRRRPSNPAAPSAPLCPPLSPLSHLFPHLISCDCGVPIFTMIINIGEPIFLNIIVYSCKWWMLNKVLARSFQKLGAVYPPG